MNLLYRDVISHTHASVLVHCVFSAKGRTNTIPGPEDEARKAAESEGVALNQSINVAVAEKVSAFHTGKYFQQRALRADRDETLRILKRAGKDNPPVPGDELPVSRSTSNRNGPQANRAGTPKQSKRRGSSQ